MSSDDPSPSGDPLAGLTGFQGRDLLSYLIEQAPIGFAVLRPQDITLPPSDEGAADPSAWRYILANPAYCAMPGTALAPIEERKSLVGLTLAEVFPPETARGIAAILDGVRRTGASASFQELEAAMGPGREQTWWNVCDYPLFDREGRVAAVLVLIYEVTDQVLARQRAEALADEAENERRRLQAVLDALPIGMAITDLQGGLLQTNRAYERVWGGPRPEAHSVDDYEAYQAWWADTGRRVEPEEWASAQAVLKGETVTGQIMEIERFDGSRAVVLNSGAPVRDATGKIVGSAVAIQDITALHQAERSLESALAESEEAARTLDALMAYVPEGITIADENLMLRMVSRYGQEILGEPHDGLTDSQVTRQWPIYQADGRTPMPESEMPLRRAIERGEVIENLELVQVNAEGRPLHLLCNAAPIRDAEGHIRGGIVAWRDITEMQATQQALRASEESYRTLFETMNEGLALHEMLYDEQGRPNDYRFLEVNPAFERQTGLPAARVLGCTVREVLPNIEAEWIERYGRVVESGEPAYFEAEAGALGRWYDVRAFRTQPGHFAVLFLDITERRRTVEALRLSEERLRLATDAAGMGAWDRDLRTGQTYWSASQFRLLGYEPTPDGSASIEAWVERIHPDDRAGAIQTLAGAQEAGTHYTNEYRIQRVDDGRTAWVRVFGRFLTDEMGRAVRTIGVMLDTTAQHEAQEALRVANETLEQRVAERTALAEERAAQLRALAVELTRAEERERRRLAALLHDHLQQFLAAASLQLHVAEPRAAPAAQAPVRQALELVDEAIKASRSLTAELSPVILHDAGLVPALHWLGRWMLQQHGLRVAVETPDDQEQGPGSEPLSEEISTLLFHSARELLYNVVKHAGVDYATLRLAYPTTEAIELVVADEGRGYTVHGPGPAAESGGQEQAEARPGLLGGFGLFSIRERLAYMGGQLHLESAPGQGTRVTLTLPLARAPQAPPEDELYPEQLEAGEAPQPQPQAVRKLRLVIADDHAIVRKGLVGLLSAEADLEVVGEAGDGLEAVEQVRDQEPDIVLMDLNMPRMDGIEATRRIVAEFPRVRVIVLSMFDDSEKRAFMRQLGAADYVAKGGDPLSLVQVIRSVGAVGAPDETQDSGMGA